MMEKYLGRSHEYGICDCASLVVEFYKHEFSISIELPDYPHSDLWMKYYTPDFVDQLLSKHGKKVPLTEAKNYALIVFKSKKSNLLVHFGVFLAPISILHIEEGRLSCIETLSDHFRREIYAIYNIV